MKLIKVCDGESTIHFLENKGTGSAIVFVHGSCGAGSQWTSLVKSLGAGLHTYQIDLPGCGHNNAWKATDRWNPSVDTAAIELLLDRIDTDIHFVLHSAAGHVSLESIRKNKHRLKSLTGC